MLSPLVSVVMVVCNVDRFLTESIESILGQTFREFEFIIVDFGSTDKSATIASSYAAKDSRIKLHTIPHCGLAEARNTGCLLAQGQYIAIMDADDIAIRDRLMWQVDFMDKHPEVGVLGGAFEWVDATGASLLTVRHPLGNNEIQSGLLNGCPLKQPTVLIRREAFAIAGGYRAVFAQSEDFDLWLRIGERFPLANLEQVVLKYRIHPHQISLCKRTEQTLCHLAARAAALSRRNGNPDPLASVKEITPAVLATLGVSKATQQAHLTWIYRDWIRIMSMAGEYSAALKATLEFLRFDLEYVHRRDIADMWLTAARLHLRQKSFCATFVAAGHAVLTWPVVVGRPLRRLLRRLRFPAVADEVRH
jgi:glycosyltransferase involved in cell wall biosynthesis